MSVKINVAISPNPSTATFKDVLIQTTHIVVICWTVLHMFIKYRRWIETTSPVQIFKRSSLCILRCRNHICLYIKCNKDAAEWVYGHMQNLIFWRRWEQNTRWWSLYWAKLTYLDKIIPLIYRNSHCDPWPEQKQSHENGILPKTNSL